MKNPRILDLLAQGITPNQVVSIVGCSGDYLRELIADTEFIEELEAKTKEYYAEANEEDIINNKFLALEAKILKQVESLLPTADMRESIKALEVVSARQEKVRNRKNPNIGEDGKIVNYNIVNLNLPSHVIPEYTLNSTREVVAINGNNMSPMSGIGVKQIFDAINKGEKLVSIA